MGETNKKIIKSGNIVEVWNYEIPLQYGYTRKKRVVDPELSNALKRELSYQNHVLGVRHEQVLKKLENALKSELLTLNEYAKAVEFENEKYEKERKVILENYEKEKEKRNAENQLRSIKRTLENATRLVNANEDQLQRFLTLTFKQDVVDLDFANGEFNKFIKRTRTYLRRQKVESLNKRRKKNKIKVTDEPLPPLEYVSVIEFQTLTRNYVIHYHVLWSAPYIPFQDLKEIWGLGGVFVNKIDRTKNVGNYILKYMKKSFQQISEEEGEKFDFEEQLKSKKSMDLLYGRQRILRSEGLNEPEEYKEKGEIQKIESRLTENLFEIGNTYESEHNGKVTYHRYNLVKNKNENS